MSCLHNIFFKKNKQDVIHFLIFFFKKNPKSTNSFTFFKLDLDQASSQLDHESTYQANTIFIAIVFSAP